MDNQDANKGSGGLANISKNFLEGKVTSTEQVKKLTDASGQIDKDSVVVQPGNFENVQSQSIVETTREEASEELAQIKAFNEEMERQQKLQERRNKTRRIIIYVILGFFGAAVAGILIWMLVNAIIAAQSPVNPGEEPDPEKPAQYDTVDGYKCETSNCYKVVELPDERILIRDEDFYIYDTTEKKATLTTIENQEYHSITPFKWGDKILLDLDPESEKSGLYSVTDNSQLISFKYDSFYRDIKDDVYREMTWVEGQYIVAKLSGSYRLARIYDGQEIIRGAERVFIHDNFCVGFEKDGERRIYTKNGKQIKVVEKGGKIFIHGSTVVYVSSDDYYFELYDSAGEEIYEGQEYDYLSEIDYEVFTETLSKNKVYYKVFDK